MRRQWPLSMHGWFRERRDATYNYLIGLTLACQPTVCQLSWVNTIQSGWLLKNLCAPKARGASTAFVRIWLRWRSCSWRLLSDSFYHWVPINFDTMPPRGNEGLDFTPILTQYLFLFTSVLSVVCANPIPRHHCIVTHYNFSLSRWHGSLHL